MRKTTSHKTPGTSTQHLVRTDSQGKVVFIPLKEAPGLKQYYLLTTTQSYTFIEGKGFVPKGVKATLELKRNENTQKLEGFKTKTLQQMFDKVTKRIQEHYLGNK